MEKVAGQTYKFLDNIETLIDFVYFKVKITKEVLEKMEKRLDKVPITVFCSREYTIPITLSCS